MSVSIGFAIPAFLALGLVCPVLSTGQGLTPEWEIRKTFQVLLNQVKSIGPVLEQVKPAEWDDAGAASGYEQQLKTIRDELGYLEQTIGTLMEKPDRMKLALEIYLRIQSTDSMLHSLIAGVRKYQNPALAEVLTGVIDEHASTRSEYREYLIELVANKEEELRIADEEAQRCQASLVRQPGARKR